jgi:hypothetical protein
VVRLAFGTSHGVLRAASPLNYVEEVFALGGTVDQALRLGLVDELHPS